MRNRDALVLVALVAFGVSDSRAAEVKECSGADLVPFEANGKLGFKDAAGKIVVEPIYDSVGHFAYGLAPVNRGARYDDVMINYRAKIGGVWGYVDTQGKQIVPLSLSSAREFADGLALVCGPQGHQYLDPTGKVAIQLGPVVSCGDFCEGLAPVIERKDKDLVTRFIDKKGRTVAAVEGQAGQFHDGMAVLTVSQKELDRNVSNEPMRYGYIDRKGKVVIPPRFAEALDFAEGLAALRPKKTTVYRMGDAWGYIDKSGKYVIEPRFNETRPFRNGVAHVHVGGTLVTPFDGIPYWEGGEWQRIDRTGKVLKQSAEEEAIQSR